MGWYRSSAHEELKKFRLHAFNLGLGVAYPKSVGTRLSVRRKLSTSHLNFMLQMSHCENKGGRVTIGEITQVFSQQTHW